PGPGADSDDSRLRSARTTGAPLASQVNGGIPPRTLSASAAPASTRAPSGGKATSGPTAPPARTAPLGRKRWSGWGRRAFGRISVDGGGGGSGARSGPIRANASKRIGAASSPPKAPGSAAPSGRPSQTPTTWAPSNPTAQASRWP